MENAPPLSGCPGNSLSPIPSPPNSSSVIADGDTGPEDAEIPTSITHPLFTSHFLSTWNSRIFEFGAVLFIAAIFPGTLLPASLYALARGGSAICLSPPIGRYIDREDRLRVVRVSIVTVQPTDDLLTTCVTVVAQRAATAISCVGFLFLTMRQTMNAWIRGLVLGTLAILACVEKLCSIMNLIAVERDWVVTIAGDHEYGLRVLNSQMRRIDLFCKLVGPLAISLIDGFSTAVAICVVLGLSLTSVTVEYFTISRVYVKATSLQEPRSASSHTSQQQVAGIRTRNQCSTRAFPSIASPWEPLWKYIRHPVALPSLSLSILYLTVLSFAAQMITYLLSIGYGSIQIGLIRTISVFLELSATWLAPMAMKRVGPVRAGLWFINWQLMCVGVATGVFWFASSPLTASIGLVMGVILSRVGLWGFDLCVQLAVQEEVEPDYRGSFSSIEASIQSFFELLSFVATAIFSRPDEFRYPVLMSSTAVFVAGILYADFVRMRRGHLLHVSSCVAERGHKGGTVKASAEAHERLLG